MRIRMVVTVTRPSERNPTGSALYGAYEHEADGTLRVYDADDCLIATDKDVPGDNARARAGRLLREKSGGDVDDFYRPIEYPRRGIV
jgi:hypothetical protein